VFCTIERQCSAVLCIQSLKEPKRFGWSRSSNEVSAPGQTREFIPASYILIARLSDAGPGYSATPGGNSLRNWGSPWSREGPDGNPGLLD
jgi:hypothetical protein